MRRLLFLFVLTALSFSAGKAQDWTLLNPGREPLAFYDVYMDTSGFGWVVGELGTILHTTDFGASWTEQSDILFGNLFYLAYVPGSNGQQAVVAGSKISATQDGGQSWSTWIPAVNVGAYQGVAAPSAQAIYVTSNQGKLLKSQDAGLTFAEVTTLPFEVEWTDMEFLTDSLGWLASREGDILQTTDGGLTWSVLHDSTFESRIEFTWLDAQTGYMVHDKDFMRSIDGGVSWDTVSENTLLFLVDDLVAVDSSTILVTQGSRISRSTNGGLTWVRDHNHPYIGTGNRGLFAHPDGKVWAANRWQSLLYSEDGGESWEDLFPGFRGFLSQVANWQADTVIAAGNSSMFIKTTNGGLDWEELTDNLPPDIDARGVAMFGAEHYLLAGLRDFFVTEDGGQSWTKTDSFATGFMLGVSKKPNGELFAPVQPSALYHSADSGNTWTELLVPGQNLRFMSWANDSLGLFTGRQGRIFRTTDGGQSWDSLAVSVQVNLGDSYWKSESEVFVMAESLWDSLLYSADGGLTWQKQALTRRTIYDEMFFADSLNGWITGGTGQTGYIFETNDGGQTWTDGLLSNGSVFFGLTAYNEDSLRIWAVGQGGMIRFLGQLDSSSNTTSVTEIAEIGWRLYPNPSQGLITLETPLPAANPLQLKVFTLQGQALKRASWHRAPQQLDLRDLASGWYLLRLQQGDQQHSQLIRILPK